MSADTELTAADGFGELVTDEQRDQMEPAVLTLAETLYEHGFGTEHALSMAWGVALLPALTEKLRNEW